MISARILLASGSIIRRQLLENAGVPFSVRPACIDESASKTALVAQGVRPRDIAGKLAEMKAQRISNESPDGVVIGTDQVLEIDGRLLGKPATITEARAQLLQLRGRRHSLVSAVVVLQNGQTLWRYTDVAHLWVRDFSTGFLERYLARMGDDVLTTVGCYKLEEQGVRLFSKIEGDYFTVLGMPLVELLNYLSETGVLEK